MFGKKYNKFGNKKTEIDGVTFDSKREANYYMELKLRQCAGEKFILEKQTSFTLQPGFKKNGVTHRPIRYVADFVLTYPNGKVEVIDVKGFRDPIFRLKQKLFEYKYPEATIILV